MAKVIIAKDTCKGCGLCVRACPKNVLALSKEETNKAGYMVSAHGRVGKAGGYTHDHGHNDKADNTVY